jgi:hypothetical protein
VVVHEEAAINVFVYLVLAAIPIALWLAMELDARKHGTREMARRKR